MKTFYHKKTKYKINPDVDLDTVLGILLGELKYHKRRLTFHRYWNRKRKKKLTKMRHSMAMLRHRSSIRAYEACIDYLTQ